MILKLLIFIWVEWLAVFFLDAMDGLLGHRTCVVIQLCAAFAFVAINPSSGVHRLLAASGLITGYMGHVVSNRFGEAVIVAIVIWALRYPKRRSTMVCHIDDMDEPVPAER